MGAAATTLALFEKFELFNILNLGLKGCETPSNSYENRYVDGPD